MNGAERADVLDEAIAVVTKRCSFIIAGRKKVGKMDMFLLRTLEDVTNRLATLKQSNEVFSDVSLPAYNNAHNDRTNMGRFEIRGVMGVTEVAHAISRHKQAIRVLRQKRVPEEASVTQPPLY